MDDLSLVLCALQPSGARLRVAANEYPLRPYIPLHLRKPKTLRKFSLSGSGRSAGGSPPQNIRPLVSKDQVTAQLCKAAIPLYARTLM